MSNSTLSSLDAVFAPRTYFYAPELEIKYKDLSQDIDALLCTLKKDQNEEFYNDLGSIIGFTPPLPLSVVH